MPRIIIINIIIYLKAILPSSKSAQCCCINRANIQVNRISLDKIYSYAGILPLFQFSCLAVLNKPLGRQSSVEIKQP